VTIVSFCLPTNEAMLRLNNFSLKEIRQARDSSYARRFCDMLFVLIPLSTRNDVIIRLVVIGFSPVGEPFRVRDLQFELT
jgi:hypothetical protein